MSSDISPIIKEKAPLILAEINKAKTVLLHCHPKPDPDSVGSALAMKFALEQLGKKVTVIKGDSDIPEAFMHFPGAGDIVKKDFFEVNLSDFDLFISLDSGAMQMVSRNGKFESPLPIKLINIDHHRSNEKFGDINLVVDTYPATAQLLFDLFGEWKVKITPEIASNLFIGIYTDTGGLKYRGTNVRSYEVMSELVKITPNFADMIAIVENSNKPESIAYLGAALSNVETFLGGKLAIASVSNETLKRHHIDESHMGGMPISTILRTVIGWNIDVGLIETEPCVVKVGLRTRDENKYDVSKLAVALGGGGHKAAAGAELQGMSLEEAKKLVVAKVKELYNL